MCLNEIWSCVNCAVCGTASVETLCTIFAERQPDSNIAIMATAIQHDTVKFKTNEVSRTAIHLTVFPPSNPLKHRRSPSKWSLGKPQPCQMNLSVSAEGPKSEYGAGVQPLVLFRLVFSVSDSTERTLWTGRLVFDSQQNQGAVKLTTPIRHHPPPTPTFTLLTCNRGVAHFVFIPCTHTHTIYVITTLAFHHMKWTDVSTVYCKYFLFVNAFPSFSYRNSNTYRRFNTEHF